MPRRFAPLAAIVGSALVVACSSSGKDAGGPAGLTVPISGVVYREGTGGASATAAPGVKVTARAGTASASATTGAGGAYSLSLSVPAGAQLVVTFEQGGAAKLARTYRINAATPLAVSATMRPLDPMDCDTGGKCQLDSGRLAVGNLEPGTTGNARVFNPVTEATAFPGAFSDSSGNLLVSGVFSALEMKAPSGAALTQMPVRVNAVTGAAAQTEAELTMELPTDTWPVVRDVTPSGDDVIVVPLYAFNEATGQWQYERDAVLVDSTGAEIPAGELAAIRARTFAGPIFARGQVTHFSWWNVDWPIETHGCVTGRVLDAGGRVATGAVVTVSLADAGHTGTSQPVTAGADGRFCLESLRSEAPGEDVDGDGVAGEVHHVSVRVSHGGALYDLGTRAMPGANGTCGASGACLALGDLTLSEAARLTARLCTVHGTVRRDGVPVAGAFVEAYDDALPWDLYEAACGQVACTPWASTDADGAYTLTAPMLGGARVTGWWTSSDAMAMRWGETAVPAPTASCPAGPFDVSLDQGVEWVTYAVTVGAGQVSWTPAAPITFLVVQSLSAGGYAWMIEPDPGVAGIAGPVTYGTLPPGAVQLLPDPGSASPTPRALAACDQLTILSQSYVGRVYHLGTGDCVLLDVSGGLTCVPSDDARVQTTCLGLPPVDPGSAATIAGTWTGDADVSGWMGQGFSGFPTLVIGDGTYSIDFDSDGTVEVAGTWAWSGADVVMQDTSGPQACATGAGTYTPDLTASAGTSYLVLVEVGADPCTGRSSLLLNEGWTSRTPAASRAVRPRILRFPPRRALEPGGSTDLQRP